MDPMDSEMTQRPLVFAKMEALVREMQDPETGVPVRSQKLFLTSIPSAFMGYDLIEWLMERLNIEDSAEAVRLANILCQSGYFFPVGDTKSLVVKDDSSLYRFQTPYYWPSQSHCPDNVEYAIYLAKRSLRNKQKHGLEDYELEALGSLKLSLQHKWDFVTMQAEEQVRLAKERKKGEKLVRDSQERAHWRVARPPPSEVQHPDAPAAQPPYPPGPPGPPSSRSPSTPHRLTHEPHPNVSHHIQMEGGMSVMAGGAGAPHSVPMAIASPPLPPWAAAVCGITAMGGRLPSSFDTNEDFRFEARRGGRQRRRRQTEEELKKEVAFLQMCLSRTRMKASQALESLAARVETYAEYDPFLTPPQPSNPWLSDDVTYWTLNAPLVEVPTEKRVKRWALSMEDLVSDPTGLQEFTWYLYKEYSHENIRFWLAVRDLRRAAQSQIQDRIRNIYQEFLVPGAPCEINIDGQTMESVQACLKQFSKEEKTMEADDDKSPSEASSISRYSAAIGGLSPRFAFDAAAEHVYALLLQKDCYPRFVRSPHYKALLANGIQPSTKKRFFNFGGPNKKKASGSGTQAAAIGLVGKKKGGDDRSLSGSIHDLAANAVRPPMQRVTPGVEQAPWESSTTALATKDSDVCPWETIPSPREQPEGQEESVVVEVEVKVQPKTDVNKVKVEDEITKKGEDKKTEDKENVEDPGKIDIKVEKLEEIKDEGDRKEEREEGREDKKIEKEEREQMSIIQERNVVKEENVEPEVIEKEKDIKKEDDKETINQGAGQCAEKEMEVEEGEEEKKEGEEKKAVIEELGEGVSGKSYVGDKCRMEVGEEKKEGGERKRGEERRKGKTDEKKPKTEKTREEKARRREERREERREGGSREKNVGKGEPGKEVSADAANQGQQVKQPRETMDEGGENSGVVMGSADQNEEKGQKRRKEGKRRHRRKGGGETEGHGTSAGGGVMEVAVTTTEWQQDRRQSEENDVCPWEDEDTCKVDAPFVKTYATLGYL